MAHAVFISYAQEDQPAAEDICSALEAEGVACWIAPRNVVTGSSWQASIVDAIPAARVFVLLLSPRAVESSYVLTEIRCAFERKEPRLPILPFRIEPTTLTKEFRFMLGGYHILDASDRPPAESLPHLVRDVKRHLDIVEPDRPIVHHAPVSLPGAATVFLSYKRNAQPDEELVAMLERELSRRGHKVFIDRHLKVGKDWPSEIERMVRQADVVIPLLSAASIHSEMLAWEVQEAHSEGQRRGGRPRLMPVRVAYEGPLPSELSPLLDRLQYFLWNGPYDNLRLVDDLIDAFHGPQVIKPPRKMPVGGLPLDAESYVRRTTDDAFHSALARRDSNVLIRGARQIGKTSLLARGVHQARQAGARVIFTDFQRFNLAELASLEIFYKSLGAAIAEELDLDVLPEDDWSPRRSANRNFEHYLRREILEAADTPLIWALDEVDRLFSCDFGTEVFALFRSWHNKRTGLDRNSELWNRLTLAISYSTEAYLFITDPNQSPFNVGTTFTLEDFTPELVVDLNARYDKPLRDVTEVEAFIGLVGGHPFLVNRGLYEMAENRLDLAAFAHQAAREDGLFDDHLRRIVVLLTKDPALCDDVRRVLGGKPALSPQGFYRLRAAGVMAGESPHDVRPRCPLYATFLKKHLGVK
jgi:hypothetical protein